MKRFKKWLRKRVRVWLGLSEFRDIELRTNAMEIDLNRSSEWQRALALRVSVAEEDIKALRERSGLM